MKEILSIVNYWIDYDPQLSFQCLDMLQQVESADRKAALYAAYGRLYLQLGNLAQADSWFTAANKLRHGRKDYVVSIQIVICYLGTYFLLAHCYVIVLLFHIIIFKDHKTFGEFKWGSD